MPTVRMGRCVACVPPQPPGDAEPPSVGGRVSVPREPATVPRSAPAPRELWVDAPSLPEAAGRYVLLQGTDRAGMPVWRRGRRRLYANAAGGWMLANDAADMCTDKGWIASAEKHRGKMPHEISAWEVADGSGGWSSARSVAIRTTFPDLPRRLVVTAPKCTSVAGVYNLHSLSTDVEEDEAWWNGFPVWTCGDRCIYSGEGGWWLIDPDRSHKSADRGLLASSDKHAGRMPQVMRCWDAADGQGGWNTDKTAQVDLSPPTVPSPPHPEQQPPSSDLSPPVPLDTPAVLEPRRFSGQLTGSASTELRFLDDRAGAQSGRSRRLSATTAGESALGREPLRSESASITERPRARGGDRTPSLCISWTEPGMEPRDAQDSASLRGKIQALEEGLEAERRRRKRADERADDALAEAASAHRLLKDAEEGRRKAVSQQREQVAALEQALAATKARCLQLQGALEQETADRRAAVRRSSESGRRHLLAAAAATTVAVLLRKARQQSAAASTSQAASLRRVERGCVVREEQWQRRLLLSDEALKRCRAEKQPAPFRGQSSDTRSMEGDLRRLQSELSKAADVAKRADADRQSSQAQMASLRTAREAEAARADAESARADRAAQERDAERAKRMAAEQALGREQELRRRHLGAARHAAEATVQAAADALLSLVGDQKPDDAKQGGLSPAGVAAQPRRF
eukprot:TRINITY_DN29800_c0_g1_i1.p1 TRINITY_DN29800_c0_g1~~TRINITY_DN29800_c0_g1_i1.p1  ORF type:complete len:690 (+),score=172.92 TRINITY_DN29800_c0_g1_i1:58-2127(+)